VKKDKGRDAAFTLLMAISWGISDGDGSNKERTGTVDNNKEL